MAAFESKTLAVTSGAWTPATFAPLDTIVKYVVQCRSGGAFKISSKSDGSDFFTVSTRLEISGVRHTASPLFYAQSVAANETLELILVS